MSLPYPTPGEYVHSAELGIVVTTVEDDEIPARMRDEEYGACVHCVFHPPKLKAPNDELCGKQPCSGVVWVDRVTYAKLRLSK